MGWKGTVRSIRATIREAERDAKRRQRELERDHKEYQKMQLLEQAAYEVEVYENKIERIQSLHKDCSETVDWHSIANSSPPVEPIKTATRATKASFKANNYTPGFFDKIFKKGERKQKTLNKAVLKAQSEDQQEYEDKLREWKSETADWKESADLAKLLFAGDQESKINVIKELNPFSETSRMGSDISFKVHANSIVEAEIHVHGEDIVPSETKSLLKSGKLSVKNMPKGMFYGIYQDYVCSCTLRVANELFSILPENMVIVTAVDELLNTESGHKEKLPILSVAIARKTLLSLKIRYIDPSDSMSNFIHNMSFKKTKGFESVERVDPMGLSNERLR
ncbi:hypothetical protein CWE09_02225 [Aliidiomarina minuta]|uniref:Uncharacterized protein n=1 Tax=Aliidiomarina minuta TaxID=880057 RepID=A0A432WAA1_9GAMM|nr:hypothetical protein [Aliidiomarina minuta]RUO27080.1 hypothetical protein CWE09_02225 [Aliidiomarina minuta]